MKQIRSAYKARLQAFAVFLYHIGKALCNGRLVLGDIKIECQNVLCLRFVFFEFLSYCLYYVIVELFVLLYVFAEDFTRLYNKLCGVGIIYGSDKRFIGGAFIASCRGVKSEPVAKMVTTRPEISVL